MAIVENFYNGDRARDIRELLTTNFANVAKYIPNNFLVLTTTERQNVTEDYKTHFKLVFDKEMQRVYRWSDIEKNWKQYLIYAWDDYARKEANKNSDTAFADVELGKTIDGKTDPYTFTFYTRAYDETNGATGVTIHHPKQAKDSVSLTGANVKFNETYSMQTITQKLIDDLKSLNDFVGDRDTLIGYSGITAKTVTGALKELDGDIEANTARLDDIESGKTKVPEAIHAEHADLADIATLAKDSEKLGGQLPTYYATKQGLDNTNDTLNNTIKRVTVNESDIAGLKQKTDDTNNHLDAVDSREQDHYKELQNTEDRVETNTTLINDLSDSLDAMATRIGWEILLA